MIDRNLNKEITKVSDYTLTSLQHYSVDSIFEYFKSIKSKINTFANFLSLLPWFLLGIVGITHMDTSWDSVAYHLPFASRWSNIFPKSEYLFYRHLEPLFEGGPKLGEIAQGALWRITGMVSATNLFGLFCILLVVMVAVKRIKVPIWLVTLFFLSIPLVLIHAKTSYTDLPANAFIVLGFVNFLAALDNKRFDNKNLFFVLFPLSIAANMKLQTTMIGALFWLVFCFIFVLRNRNIILHAERAERVKYWLGFSIVNIILALLFSTNYIVNFVRFQNPFYPISMQIGPVAFKGEFLKITINGPLSIEMDIHDRDQTSQNKFAIYLASLFETRLWTENRGLLWSVDMGAAWGVEKINSPFFKTGGYFAANLVLWASFLIISLFHIQDRKSIFGILFVLGTFLFVGLLPASFELRYWLFLPLVLAVLVLWIYKNNSDKLKDTFRLVVILQLFIFSFVAYQANFVFPTSNTFTNLENGVQNLPSITTQYDLDIQTSSYVCIVGDTRMGFYYKISNPEIRIQSAINEAECKGPIVVHP